MLPWGGRVWIQSICRKSGTPLPPTEAAHRLISWLLPWLCVGARVSWLYSPTKNLRDGNCCHAQGQLLPGLATYISGTVFTPRKGMANSQQVVYTMYSLWLESSLKWGCFFNQLLHPLSWGQCCPGLQRTQQCYLQGHRERISGLPKGEVNLFNLLEKDMKASACH